MYSFLLGLFKKMALSCENGFNHAVNIACLDIVMEKELQHLGNFILYIRKRQRQTETEAADL